MTAEQLFLLRFNFQNMLRQPVDPNDSIRIANILDLKPEETKTVLKRFDMQNEEAAREIASEAETDKFKEMHERIIFIGDSITSDRLSFFNILRKVFKQCNGIELLDASVSGWRSGDVLQDLCESVLSKETETVVFTLGTNDLRKIGGKFTVTSQKEYERNINLIFTALRSRRLIVNTLPPFDADRVMKVYGNLGWSFEIGDLKDYNDILRKTARKYEAILNDTVVQFENAIEAGFNIFHEDGLHLSGTGQSIIAKSLFTILKNLWREDEK